MDREPAPEALRQILAQLTGAVCWCALLIVCLWPVSLPYAGGLALGAFLAWAVLGRGWVALLLGALLGISS